jgi:hypothetical protein
LKTIYLCAIILNEISRIFTLRIEVLYNIPHKSPATAESYLYTIERYILPRFGKKKLKDLKPMEIQKYFNDLAKESPLSGNVMHPKTIRNIYMNFNAALKRAVKL